MKNFLIAVDLEGVHGVVGEPYVGLVNSIPDYSVAVANATSEINEAVRALYDAGADTVFVWDNYGGGNNVDFSLVDERAVPVLNKKTARYSRFSCIDGCECDGVLYVGYHARAGSRGGVLSHTYSSKDIQYYKLHGEQVGEFEIDAYIAADRGIPPVFISSDDVCVSEARKFCPDIKYAVTKIGKGRNSAEFLPQGKVLGDIYNAAFSAAQVDIAPRRLAFPCPVEIRYTRMETAEKKLENLLSSGIDADYGEDTHTVKFTVNSIYELEAIF